MHSAYVPSLAACPNEMKGKKEQNPPVAKLHFSLAAVLSWTTGAGKTSICCLFSRMGQAYLFITLMQNDPLETWDQGSFSLQWDPDLILGGSGPGEHFPKFPL